MKHSYDPKLTGKRQRNCRLFAETMRICKDGWYQSPSGYRHVLPSQGEVLASSIYYRNPARVDRARTYDTMQCEAVNEDSVLAVQDLVRNGYRPILLNMANLHTPGGGVLNGARAQEESLFRRSNLCVSLYQYDEYHAGLIGVPPSEDRYPMNRETGGIYSGRVVFFRSGPDNGDGLMDDPFECAVVSVAAINRPELDGNGKIVPWAAETTKTKIRTMLRIGILNGHDAIVLGAWGCGAFRNPPEHMARLFHEILCEKEFMNKYRVVRFAVIDDHNSKHGNFAAFDREFNDKAVVVSPMPECESWFPETLTADMLRDFVTTPQGCTHPRVGDIGGHHFIAKCGDWSAYSSDDHVHNEVVADNILRAAGLLVPPSREYRVDFGNGKRTVRLALYGDLLKPIMDVWIGADKALRVKIRIQVLAAYPVQVLIAGIDTFTWDNVRVDPKGNLWFVDNGASFEYRASGKRKGWFWERKNPMDPENGYLSLFQHKHQGILRELLGPINADMLWYAARNIDFTQLISSLPETYRRYTLVEYARAMDDITRGRKTPPAC